MSQFDQFLVGHPHEWELFQATEAALIRALPNITACGDALFNRTFTTERAIDRVIFAFGIFSRSDFDELLVLAGNGLGYGCLKILRGCYERAVVSAYLHTHPEEVDRFLDFHHIADYKQAVPLNAFFEGSLYSDEQIEEKQRLRQEVMEQFMVPCCAHVDDKRLHHSWSRLDLIAMARAADKRLGDDGGLELLAGPAYYMPMAHTHASVNSILANIDEAMLLGHPDKARAHVGPALQVAWELLLFAFWLQLRHFPEMRGIATTLLEQCKADFTAPRARWPRKASM